MKDDKQGKSGGISPKGMSEKKHELASNWAAYFLKELDQKLTKSLG